MANNITIPVIDYKMDKVKFVIAMIVVVALIIILVNPSGVLSTLFKGLIDEVGNIFKGVTNGIVNGVNDVTGVTAQDTSNDNYSKRIDKYWGGSWVNWMLPDLYNSSPGSVTIDAQTALNLYNNVRSAEGTSILGVTISHGDMSGLQDQFSSVVGNKFDISYVSFVAQQQEGNSLGQIFESNTNFYNDSVGSSGKSNLQMQADFLDWANGLSTY